MGVLKAHFSTLKPRKIGRLFADDILKLLFFDENVWILIEISLKFVAKVPINTYIFTAYYGGGTAIVSQCIQNVPTTNMEYW